MNITQPKVLNRNGYLYVSFTIDGKQVRQSLGLKDTKQNRKNVELTTIPELLLRIQSDTKFFNNPKTPTLNEYSETSFLGHESERKKHTNIDYRNTYKKHIAPDFGHMQLDKITVSALNIWKTNLVNKLGLSVARANSIKKIFGTILEDAYKDEIIDSNPMKKTKPIKQTKIETATPFSLDEVGKILDAAEGQDKNLIATLFMAGLRTGELIGLMWSDIDLKHNTITVNRTIGRGNIGTPKTRNSNRSIGIVNALKPYLENQLKITGSQNSYVFLNSEGRHFFDSKNIRDGLWKKVLKKANVDYRYIYNTRHTYCSINIQSGENILWVSKNMGHSNSNITLSKYAHFIPQEIKRDSVFDKLAG